jgi:hypothetical protein
MTSACGSGRQRADLPRSTGAVAFGGNSARTPDILAAVLHGFPQSLPTNAAMVHQVSVAQ